MSTHNLGFYEDLEKNYLSIIIKYTPYLFYCRQFICSICFAFVRLILFTLLLLYVPILVHDGETLHGQC